MLSKLIRIIGFSVLVFLCSSVLVTSVFASDNSFVTIINPVRGGEFWGLANQEPLDAIVSQYEVIRSQDLTATWLLRYDALRNPEIVSFFNDVNQDQELGLFLEVIPSLAKKAEVPYPEKGIFWHDANRVFLSGYQPEERKRLVDAVFENFLIAFGYYPESVGAWHIDAYSASYMKEKYGITGVLICADQFATDSYQIWGQPWGVPYYPSKLNIQVPAQTRKNKLDLVVFQWAVRDPEKGYGGSVNESIYSVQANDYLKHDLTTTYFQKLVEAFTDVSGNPFGQVTVGLENDNDWEKYGGEYKKQVEVLAEMKEKGEFRIVTMADFAYWYKNHFPRISPPMKIEYQKATWISNPQYRLGLIIKDSREYIRDLRIYNEQWPEAYYLTPNPWPSLNLSYPAEIDTVRFPETLVQYDPKLVQDKLTLPFFPQKTFLLRSNKLCLLFYCSIVLLLISFVFLKNKCLGILVALGTLGQSLTMIKSGLLYPFGMGFWGPNGHDGIWHFALINQIAKGSFFHPVFAGASLANYHFGFDFLDALIHRITGISSINLYFQILPVIFSLLLGILTYLLVKKWMKSELAALLATFFVYFGGSWGWVITLLREGRVGGESIFWANQSVSFLINPPYALSIIFSLLGLYFFLDYLEKPTRKLLVVLSLIFGTLIQVKVYAGMIVLGSLGILGAIRAIGVIGVRSRRVLYLFAGSLLVALVVFLPFNLRAGSLLFFSPLWFPRTMLAFQDRLGWVRLENARQAYLATGQWAKWLLAEGLALTIFILGNLGTRILGFGWLVPRFRRNKGDRGSKGNRGSFEVFLGLALLISLSLTFTFIQKGNPWNTIQFFYYFQFIMAILAGIFLAIILDLLRNKLGKLVLLRSIKLCLLRSIKLCLLRSIKLCLLRSIKLCLLRSIKLCLLATLVLLTIPTTLGTLFYNYLPSRPPARISFEELEALEFLKQQQEGVVLTYPYNPEWREKFSEPKPLYAYETTAYVSAFSGKQTFLEDEMNLEISGYNWQPRREKEIRFFGTDNKEWAREFLQDNKIRYIYLVKGQKMNLGEDDIGARKIFENGEVKIYNRDTDD